MGACSGQGCGCSGDSSILDVLDPFGGSCGASAWGDESVDAECAAPCTVEVEGSDEDPRNPVQGTCDDGCRCLYGECYSTEGTIVIVDVEGDGEPEGFTHVVFGMPSYWGHGMSTHYHDIDRGDDDEDENDPEGNGTGGANTPERARKQGSKRERETSPTRTPEPWEALIGPTGVTLGDCDEESDIFCTPAGECISTQDCIGEDAESYTIRRVWPKALCCAEDPTATNACCTAEGPGLPGGL